jgi:hypothetical protein
VLLLRPQMLVENWKLLLSKGQTIARYGRKWVIAYVSEFVE